MNKNQNGFATLEFMLIIGIVGIFINVVIPKMERVIDKVALNYEMKHLYSELNFAHSIGKSSTYNGDIFPSSDSQQKIEIWLYSKNYTNASARNRYQIMRTSLTSAPYFRHKLTNGIKLEFKNGDQVLKIACNNRTFPRSYTITLNSAFEKKAYIYLDTVGRVSGDYKERY